MGPLGVTAIVIGDVQLGDEIKRVSNALQNCEGPAGDKQVLDSLEISRQKLRLWAKTWLDDDSDSTMTWVALWGTQGQTEIVKLFRVISDVVQKLNDAEREPGKLQSRPSFFNNDMIQNTKHKSGEVKSASSWKRAKSFLQRLPKKTSPTIIVRPPTMLELATELNSSIDELWTYSEVAFDSLHGLLATRAIGLPAGSLVRPFLADAIWMRAGAVELYRACSKWTRDCSLELDMFGIETLRTRSAPESSHLSLSLFYHLFMQKRDSPAKLHMTIESSTRPGTPNAWNGETVKYENIDLGLLEVNSASDNGIVVRSKAADTSSFFRPAKLLAEVTLIPETQNLAQILYQEKTTNAARTLPFSARVELAFKLVECSLYLLGTPWLASLNSKRLRRINLDNGPEAYVLEVQTLDLDELSFEDPKALAEPSQLFRIGLLLVEIALSNPEHSVPAETRELDLRTSKMLTLVQQSMGPQYGKATAFCLHNRRSTVHFGRPEKYQYPERTGWKSYLLDLLEDYHAQVYLR